MPYQLFLDDERDPYKVTWVELPLGPWIIARSYAEFTSTIQKRGLPSFISFDHDLADEHYRDLTANPASFREKTGTSCAHWLIEYCLEHQTKLPPYQVHSMNPIGRDNIRSLLESGRRALES